MKSLTFFLVARRLTLGVPESFLILPRESPMLPFFSFAAPFSVSLHFS
jgi:hypothetical protein